ncbi:L-PSP (mRNA) endoribonuclease [Candidatus Competibacter denitrificans Run_A_D11]|uniref:L-PSP (mRNA) endoribonuclease n=1 Tax=Candidatus Competibacter denitrificans Run_A_D11 TaxID=1400863 RepID=W6M5Q5_9GAMM|nr:RidA family protein [Candidatus Competibacter denitrificans]CDI03211.1 L-PSP (mRNA) endoribonuclease [Candidatus Competibacter denitrificans Run_A_D11]HAS87254.1 RidA family protein [Candidatus Competibacteraceae bacterium]HRC70017.1 RidA family protein [Candidatus Competibacter denitrificans]
MPREIISTSQAPAAIGTYSQAVKVGDTVYLSGQIPLDPVAMQLVTGDISAQIRQVFDNLKAVAQAAGGSLADTVKLNVFLTDLSHFAAVNQIMAEYFHEPYPARAAIGVAALPRGAQVEMDAVLVLGQ